MDVLLLCGYFEPKYQEEISRKTKTWVENAANIFQQRLIDGLASQKINLKILSAPFIGPWPTCYKDFSFHGFEIGQSEKEIQYVSFNNIWGYRNISRSLALKDYVNRFVVNSKSKNKTIIVYCPHTPFLEAACFGKKLDSSIHIHMVVPDLPQYMNLSKKAHPIYDFFKKIDILKMKKCIRQVDSFTLLTEYMAEKLEVGTRPYIVVEGITDLQNVKVNQKKKSGKKIAYAGKLIEAFGVKRLIEAFELIEDPETTLHICGGGELKSYVDVMCQKDTRIHYYGVVSSERANELLQSASVLVNPRQNDSEYTKYSFPSKNIEYLMTGSPVVAYMLDGIPKNYQDFFEVPHSNDTQALAEAIKAALYQTEEVRKERFGNVITYLSANIEKKAVAKRIVNTIKGL